MASKEDLLSSFSSILKDLHSEISKQFITENPVRPKLSQEMPDLVMQVHTYWDFIKALPYNDLWMICLMLFHVALFLLIVSTRKYHNTQYAIFFFLLLLVSMSEKLNETAAQHWNLFSRENFFDSGGLFISTVFSFPLLVNCSLLIALWLKFSLSALIKIKTKQISKSKEKQDVETETKKER